MYRIFKKRGPRSDHVCAPPGAGPLRQCAGDSGGTGTADSGGRRSGSTWRRASDRRPASRGTGHRVPLCHFETQGFVLPQHTASAMPTADPRNPLCGLDRSGWHPACSLSIRMTETSTTSHVATILDVVLARLAGITERSTKAEWQTIIRQLRDATNAACAIARNTPADRDDAADDDR